MASRSRCRAGGRITATTEGNTNPGESLQSQTKLRALGGASPRARSDAFPGNDSPGFVFSCSQYTQPDRAGIVITSSPASVRGAVQPPRAASPTVHVGAGTRTSTGFVSLFSATIERPRR